ncbi:MFS transporter [Kiritimatiella glycovorans]|uniref:Thiomethylgalactoside permease II n=1 Tax=Kiritimatiella glycovorans TaxID=1307763 RepID=A0A0G3EE31_9BACT|nr:MFS transporter [Kiritimatiella glycovorans]AKJ64716.1 Thiomethylgalactoside permease II [Kiritimatiella glycovorans]
MTQKKPPQDNSGRLPRSRKFAYGLGGFCECFLQNNFNVIANPVLNIGLGVSPALVSTAMTIPRIWDAFTDPVMGSISDNFRSRHGRRRPFILLGGILTAISYAAIWWFPPGLSEMGYFFFFLGMLLLFYTCVTIFLVPYIALGFELTPDYNERTRVMGFKAFFSVSAGLAMNWMFWLTKRPVFPDIVEGMKWVGLGFGVVILICALTPAVFLRERILTASAAEHGAGPPKTGIVKSIKAALSTKPFLLILLCCVSVIIGVMSIMQVGLYLNIYYVCAGDQDFASQLQGIVGTCYQAASIATVPAVSWLGTHLGKRRALMTILSLGIIGSISTWFMLTPEMPYLQIVPLLFSAPAIGGLWILAPSMIADVCDYDEMHSRRRREGIFGAAFGWFTKLGSSAAILASGFALVWTGFDVSLETGQIPTTIVKMRLANAFIPAFAFLIAIIAIRKYFITEEMANDIRAKLGRNHEQNPETA